MYRDGSGRAAACAMHVNTVRISIERGACMPIYKDYAVLASGLSLADRGKPGRYVPFASLLACGGGVLRLARQLTWLEHETASADSAKRAAERLARQLIDSENPR